jgi:hypothetical protein
MGRMEEVSAACRRRPDGRNGRGVGEGALTKKAERIRSERAGTRSDHKKGRIRQENADAGSLWLLKLPKIPNQTLSYSHSSILELGEGHAHLIPVSCDGAVARRIFCCCRKQARE